MEFTFLGHSCFKIRTKKGTLVCDPFDPEMVGLKFPKVSADIVTVSHDHKDHNQAQLVNGKPKVVSGPGEYEIGEIQILGIPTYHDDKEGKLRGKNTVYAIEAEGIRVCHLGDLGHKLGDREQEALGAINVLLVPVGGEYTINAKTAASVISQVEPDIVIPMHYQMSGLKKEVFSKLAPVEDFVSEIGIEPRRETKYSITAPALPEEMQLVLLEKKG